MRTLACNLHNSHAYRRLSQVMTVDFPYYPSECYLNRDSDRVYFNDDGYNSTARYYDPLRVPICDTGRNVEIEVERVTTHNKSQATLLTALNISSNTSSWRREEHAQAGVSKFMAQEADTASALGTFNLVLALSVIFTIYFFVARKCNPSVYVLRHKQDALKADGINKETIARWLHRLVYKTDEDILAQVGFDGYMMLRLPLLGIKFCFVCLPGMASARGVHSC